MHAGNGQSRGDGDNREHQGSQNTRHPQRRTQRDQQQNGQCQEPGQGEMNGFGQIAAVERVRLLLEVQRPRVLHLAVLERRRNFAQVNICAGAGAAQRQQGIPPVLLMQDQRIES